MFKWLLLLAAAAFSPLETFGASTKPNLIIILADDFGWGNIGYHRSDFNNEVQTPNLDFYAHSGVKLERYYSYRICGPSRCSLQTGRLPLHVNTANGEPTIYNPLDPVSGYAGIPRNMTGFAEKLKSLAGYRTVFSGKWDVGMATPRHTPQGRGYDQTLAYFHHANDYYTCKPSVMATGAVDVCYNRFLDLWTNEGPAIDLAGTAYEEILLEQHTVDAIQNHNPEIPLLLVHSFHLVHTPLQVPQEYLDKFAFIDYPNRRSYAAMTNYMDGSFGRIVSALKQSGLYANSVCMFMSDNGGPLPFPGSGNNHPLRGGKWSDFEGGVRVNAFAFGGLIPEGRRGTKSNDIVHVSDMYASLLRLALYPLFPVQVNPEELAVQVFDEAAFEAGLPPVDSVDTLWSAIAGAPPVRNEIQLSENALLRGEYKLLTGMQGQNMWCGPFYPNFTGYQPPMTPSPNDLNCTLGCLFNVFQDPTEHEDLAQEMPELVQEMMARLDELNESAFNPDRGVENATACAVFAHKYSGFYGPFLDLPSDCPVCEECPTNAPAFVKPTKVPTTFPTKKPKKNAGRRRRLEEEEDDYSENSEITALKKEIAELKRAMHNQA